MFKKHFAIIIFLIVYFFIVSYKLISHPTPFFDWDESINVQVGKEMIENKSPVPLWQGKVWLDKPPLPFLFFGLLMKLTPFVRPEIILRITSLLLSVIALTFIYILFHKGSGNKFIAFLSVLITSFTPIFLQRSQIVNLDVFLLIGWLGYLIFVQNFWLSLLFLAISVLTKSLIGFYPIPLLLFYHLFFAKNKKIVSQLLAHCLLLSLWYMVMLIFFGRDFWQQHIIETHFMRVTASIESHFGQKTYYLDLLRDQLGIFFWLSLLGLIFAILNILKNLTKNKNYEWILYSLFLLPWFIFLNLTKTKIFWYLYPAIPQFAFLSVYPLSFLSFKPMQDSKLNGFRIRWGMSIVIATFVIFYLFYSNFIKTNFFTTFYSKPEDYYQLALFARGRCDSLNVLVSKESREANQTLENLGLTITSTKQWGDHPSIVYYFGKKVNFIYDEENIINRENGCFIIGKNDIEKFNLKKLKIVKKVDSLYILK